MGRIKGKKLVQLLSYLKGSFAPIKGGLWGGGALVLIISLLTVLSGAATDTAPVKRGCLSYLANH